MTDVPNTPMTRSEWTRWFFDQDAPDVLSDLPVIARVNVRLGALRHFLQQVEGCGLIIEEGTDD